MNKLLLELRAFTQNISCVSQYLTKNFVKCFTCRLLFTLFFSSFGFSSAFADGSKDLYPSGVAGNRAFLVSATTTTGGSAYVAATSFPFINRGVHYAYVKAGEFIAAASSAQAVATNGQIILTAPNGNVFSSTVGSNTGRIYVNGTFTTTRASELGGSRVGYQPFQRQATAAQEGVWKIEFVAGPTANTSSVNVLADAAWTQADGASIAAWDVSVFADGTTTSAIGGRVYTNVFNSIINENFATGRGFYGKFYVLTKDGYSYLVNENGQVGVSSTFFVNNNGFKDANGKKSYKSVNSTTNPPVKNPTTDDTANEVTHKIFYQKPAADLPVSAVITPTTSTWLKAAAATAPTVSNFSFAGVEGSTSNISSKGAYINFDSNVSGSYKITIPGGGAFIDRILTGQADAGANTVLWDGRAGLSASDPVSPGTKVPPGTTVNTIRLQLLGGEVHFPSIDVEINPNGTIIQQLNSAYNPIAGQDIVYWDDTDITVAGTPSNPTKAVLGVNSISSATNGHKWGANPGAGLNDFGNNKSLDTYTFIPGSETTQSVNAVISQADLRVTSITPSTTSAKVGSTITYTVVLENLNNATSVSNVTGAVFNLEYPSGFSVTSATSVVNAGTITQTATSTSATVYATTLNMTSGSRITYTITGTVGSALSNTTVAARATILRSADVSDPDATDESTTTFSGNADTECNGTPSGVGCNNIVTSAGVAVPASVSITATTPNASEPATNGLFTVNLTSAVTGTTTVTYSIAGSAQNGVDYNTASPLTGSVTIPAGQTSATIPVTVFDDQIVEGNENVVLVITGVSNTVTTTVTTALNAADLTATVNIADNDSATISVATTDAS
ncbi:Calx-beta domain-containing protein, partial [Pedobacter sandarakinus]|uniref:Calx-beta domain-containing protein n=1 Tax=Pedobacter sandarakinus TaxID=353156 RepID=UPI002AFDD130